MCCHRITGVSLLHQCAYCMYLSCRLHNLGRNASICRACAGSMLSEHRLHDSANAINASVEFIVSHTRTRGRVRVAAGKLLERTAVATRLMVVSRWRRLTIL